ncbi:hypothetical protein HPB48_005179 [Haemaphysalis longicornis]|uniref:Uncharacterized protein n=1 Tax=Haemaphysalis longicornis TaxID=44386 RepID=A0A9J6FIF9_HAELO|nr:hypothetical protein HPB48_005179 [Haemaphysalis longicornis]
MLLFLQTRNCLRGGGSLALGAENPGAREWSLGDTIRLSYVLETQAYPQAGSRPIGSYRSITVRAHRLLLVRNASVENAGRYMAGRDRRGNAPRAVGWRVRVKARDSFQASRPCSDSVGPPCAPCSCLKVRAFSGKSRACCESHVSDEGAEVTLTLNVSRNFYSFEQSEPAAVDYELGPYGDTQLTWMLGSGLFRTQTVPVLLTSNGPVHFGKRFYLNPPPKADVRGDLTLEVQLRHTDTRPSRSENVLVPHRVLWSSCREQNCSLINAYGAASGRCECSARDGRRAEAFVTSSAAPTATASRWGRKRSAKTSASVLGAMHLRTGAACCSSASTTRCARMSTARPQRTTAVGECREQLDCLLSHYTWLNDEGCSVRAVGSADRACLRVSCSASADSEATSASATCARGPCVCPDDQPPQDAFCLHPQLNRPQVAHTQEGGGAKERHQVDASLAIRDAIIYSSPLCAEACQCGRPPRPPRSEDFKRASPTAAALAAGGHSGGACTPDAADRESGPGPGWALEEGPLLLPAVVAPLVDDARRLLIPVRAFSNTHNPHFHSRPAQDGAVSHSSRH